MTGPQEVRKRNRRSFIYAQQNADT